MIKKQVLICLMICMVTLFLFSCENTQPHENDADQKTLSNEDMTRENTQPHENDAEGIDPAVALKLRKDYLEQVRSEHPNTEIDLEDIRVQEYYGTYSGCEVVFMEEPFFYTMASRKVAVADYIITFGNSQKLYIHKDSHFYTVNEAYDAGYITKADIEAFGPEVGVDFKE